MGKKGTEKSKGPFEVNLAFLPEMMFFQPKGRIGSRESRFAPDGLLGQGLFLVSQMEDPDNAAQRETADLSVDKKHSVL